MSPKDSKLRTDTFAEITPEMVDYYIKKGNRIRSETITAMFRNMLGAIRILPERQPDGQNNKQAHIAHGLRSSLAAIRSSGELIRDDPSLSVAERSRFINIVLVEAARLELLLTKLGGRPRKSMETF